MIMLLNLTLVHSSSTGSRLRLNGFYKSLIVHSDRFTSSESSINKEVSMKKNGIAIGYQVELPNNSLFYKISKTLACEGFEVFAVGVRRTGEKVDYKGVKLLESQLDAGCSKSIKYLEILVNMGYALGFKNLFGVLKYQIITLIYLLKMAKEIAVFYAVDFLMGVPFFLASVLLKKPFVYHIADRFVDSYKLPGILRPIFASFEKLLITKARFVIVPSESRIDNTLEKCRDKVVVIYNTPEDVCRNSIDGCFRGTYERGRLKLAYFGVLSQDRFIKQLCEAVRNNDKLELDIGGYGALQEFVEEASKSCKRIKFFGSVPYEDVLRIQAASNLLVAMYDPSITNNANAAPNKLYEAMMLGKPIIVAKGMGIDEFVEDNRIGFVVAYNLSDFEHLIKHITECDPQTLEAIGMRGRKLYETYYSWQLMRERLMNTVKKVISKDSL